MRKGSIPIEYMFLMVLGVIAVFIIIGILTKWAFMSNRYVDKMTGDDKTAPDITIIKTTNLEADLVKHKTLCAEKCKSGAFTDLCYVLEKGTQKILIRCNKQNLDQPIVER